jgi:hypothetical protein
MGNWDKYIVSDEPTNKWDKYAVKDTSTDEMTTITLPDQSKEQPQPQGIKGFGSESQEPFNPTQLQQNPNQQIPAPEFNPQVKASNILRQKQIDKVKTTLTDIFQGKDLKGKESIYAPLINNPYMNDDVRDKVYDLVQKKGKYTDEEMNQIKGDDINVSVPLAGFGMESFGHKTVRLNNPATGQKEIPITEQHEWLTNPLKVVANDAVIEGFKGGYEQLKQTEKVYDTEGEQAAAAVAAAGISKMVFGLLMATPQGMAFSEGIKAAEDTPLKTPISVLMQPATTIANYINKHPESEGGKAALEIADFIGMTLAAGGIHKGIEEAPKVPYTARELYRKYKGITPEQIATGLEEFNSFSPEKQQSLIQKFAQTRVAPQPQIKTKQEVELDNQSKQIDDITNHIGNNPEQAEILQPKLNDLIISHDNLQEKVAKTHIEDAIKEAQTQDLIEKKTIAQQGLETANETVKPILEQQIKTYDKELSKLGHKHFDYESKAPKLPTEEQPLSPTVEFSGEEVKSKGEYPVQETEKSTKLEQPKETKDTFENREKIEFGLNDLGDNVFYHGSDDISYLNSKDDINTLDNTKNAKSKYLYLTKNKGTAISYSIHQQKIGEKSGVAAFKLKGKGYTTTKNDIKNLKSINDYEEFNDKKKSEGYDYIKVPQDANNIVVLNNNAIEYIGKKLNKDSINDSKPTSEVVESQTTEPTSPITDLITSYEKLKDRNIAPEERRKINNERKELLDKHPTIKHIFDNIADIHKQLGEQITKRGDCP